MCNARWQKLQIHILTLILKKNSKEAMFTNPKSGKWKEDGSPAKKTCLMIHNQEKAEQMVHLLKAFPEVG